MMKRINLRNLRVSTHANDPVVQSDDSEYEEPLPLQDESDTVSLSGAGDHRHFDPLANPRSIVRRKQEKKSFFKSLRRKLMTNFKIKRDHRHHSPGGIIDDDSSSENHLDEEIIHAHSTRRPRTRCAREARSHKAKSKGESLESSVHFVKGELAKSISTEESSAASPTEEEQFVGDDYGHTSAISSNSLDVPGCQSRSVSPHQPHSRHSYQITAGGASSSTAGLDQRNIQLDSSHVPSDAADESDFKNLRIPLIPLPDLPQGTHLTREPARSWSLTKELFRLSKYGWYWGPITRPESEEKLLRQPDGAFLVRDSSDDRYLLSLSFRSYGRTLHTRIEHCNGLFSFYAQPDNEGFSSIVELIEHSMSDSEAGVFCYSRARAPGSPSFPVRLTKPISRFNHVRTLQYLCRFEIRQYTRYDHIQKLPLPASIKAWLQENQYG